MKCKICEGLNLMFKEKSEDRVKYKCKSCGCINMIQKEKVEQMTLF